MILQKEFKDKGYINLLEGKNARDNEMELADLYDLENRPEELIGIYLSPKKDELFIVLNTDFCDINHLCDSWDDRIRGYIIINKGSENVQKYKYNIVQLIVYSGNTIDKNCETNLLISRKILIQGNMSDLNNIYIDDFKGVELPFFLISPKTLSEDKEKERMLQKLKDLLPKDEKLLNLLTEEKKKTKGILKEGKRVKSFSEEEFKSIKGWLGE